MTEIGKQLYNKAYTEKVSVATPLKTISCKAKRVLNHDFSRYKSLPIVPISFVWKYKLSQLVNSRILMVCVEKKCLQTDRQTFHLILIRPYPIYSWLCWNYMTHLSSTEFILHLSYKKTTISFGHISKLGFTHVRLN